MAVTIKSVIKNSYAYRAGCEAGDTLLSINGNDIVDVLDYRFYQLDSDLELKIRDIKGEVHSVKVRKPEYEELGLDFDTYLMDKERSCRNKCIFCFIDQLPKGLRESLYFKDDDSRLSFLFGNYITLTNLSEHEIQRIIKMHISPINVSVHTTDPELRVKMMGNRFAGDSLKILKRFAEHNININTHIAELLEDIHGLTGFLRGERSQRIEPLAVLGQSHGYHRDQVDVQIIEIAQSFLQLFPLCPFASQLPM